MIEFYGWSDPLHAAFEQYAARGFIPARVTAHHRSLWEIATPKGEMTGRLSGRFALDATPGQHPVVGDWLAVSHAEGTADALIHAVLPRRTVFSRRAAGGHGIQVIAANIDVALLVAALNGDLNVRRLERYLVAARDSGAAPVIVLTKADLSSAPENEARRVIDIAGGAPVVTLSAVTGVGLYDLNYWLAPGVTAALLGSSGAGKSTLLNALAGLSLMDTGAIRDSDDRGRHTTTHRELFLLPSGAMVVDTPGMREIGLLEVDVALDASFEDVTALLPNCRFGNCTHANEPGCVVLAALADGSLSDERWRAYLKLQKELAFAARKSSPEANAANRMRHKPIHKARRAKYVQRRRNEES
jgi:ribosome biogenesis GTPase / thiamine phosphate phosphatase